MPLVASDAQLTQWQGTHLPTLSIALLTDVFAGWGSCARSGDTHCGHHNRSGECNGHQPDLLLQRSLVRRAWRSSPTATRNAQSVGADDLSAQIMRSTAWYSPLAAHPSKVVYMYKLCTRLQDYKCLHGVAASYLMEMCRPVSNVSGRSCLHSSSYIFAVSGPTYWNSLPQSFSDATPTLGRFHRRLKTSLFRLAYGRDLTAHSRLSRL